jgi:hypothetical protein
MLPGGGGDYVAFQSVVSYVPPSATATALTLVDDSQAIVTLTSPFPYAGSSTTSLAVCSNGYVSVATGNGTAWAPVAATMLAAPQTGWWNWHDYNPTMAGSGLVKFEQVGAIAYITWDGVYDHQGTTAANANTFQFQFDTTSGAVHLVFQTMSALGNGRLVGYSPGGASLNPGAQDLSALLPVGINVPAGDRSPLALAASARPLIGTSINLTTSGTTGTNLGVMFFGLASIPSPGIDLAAIGAPGCAALVDVNQAVGNLIGNLPGTNLVVPLPIPNSTTLLGFACHAQSIWLDAAANNAGFVTSNGVSLVLGNL